MRLSFIWSNSVHHHLGLPSWLGLTFILLVISCSHIGFIRMADDGQDDGTMKQMKQMRRSEVSKALLLLKKHSVVGSDAKIVLKNNGRHLLVDPSEKIRVVPNHIPKTRKIFKLNKINKYEKQKKRSNRNKSSKDHLSKASRSIPFIEPNVELIQRNIMRRAASKTPNVIDSLMGQQMLKDITQLVTTIVRNKQAGSLMELSDLITETLNERYGAHWHTISVASPKAFPHAETMSNHELLIDTILANQNQQNSLTHVALDDHQKSATFYATFDFGRTLRIFIFK